MRPVVGVQALRQLALQLAGHIRGFVDIAQFGADAGHRIAHLKQLLRVNDVDQRQTVVIGRHADFKNAHHAELFQARHHAGRRDRTLRRDQHDFFAHPHAQRTRKIGTQHDAEFGTAQAVQPAYLDLVGKFGDGRLAQRVDAAHHHTLHALPERQHALSCHVRCGSQHLRVLCDLVQNGLPVFHAPAVGNYFQMRGCAQHARADFLLKAVHHRQHDDQCHHAEAHA